MVISMSADPHESTSLDESTKSSRFSKSISEFFREFVLEFIGGPVDELELEDAGEPWVPFSSAVT